MENMNLEQVEARLAEIRAMVDTAENIDELSAEVDALNERRSQIMAEQREAEAEKRQALLDTIATGAAGTETRSFENMEAQMEKRTFAPNTEEYRAAWLKAQMGLELDAEERSAMATVDVVPTITENRILGRLKEYSLLKYIDLTNFKGYVNIPNYTTDGDAAWNTSNEQQDAIGHVALSLYQLIKTVEVPGKFNDVSIDAFEDYLTAHLVNKIQKALQTAVILGAGGGSSQPTGINVTHSTADGEFTHSGITKADLMTIMGSLGAEYQQDAVWIMPNHVFYEAMAVVDLPGFVALNAELRPIIGGKPVVIDDSCIISSTDTIFYGAAKAYHMNLGAPIEVSRDESVGFKSNAVNYRAVTLADGKLDNTDAFVKYTRATE